MNIYKLQSEIYIEAESAQDARNIVADALAIPAISSACTQSVDAEEPE